jgi:hypothetical protein
MQYIIVFTILSICIFLAGRQFYKAVRMPNDPCNGCQGCQLKDKMKEKQLCKNKKC